MPTIHSLHTINKSPPLYYFQPISINRTLYTAESSAKNSRSTSNWPLRADSRTKFSTTCTSLPTYPVISHFYLQQSSSSAIIQRSFFIYPSLSCSLQYLPVAFFQLFLQYLSKRSFIYFWDFLKTSLINQRGTYYFRVVRHAFPPLSRIFPV